MYKSTFTSLWRRMIWQAKPGTLLRLFFSLSLQESEAPSPPPGPGWFSSVVGVHCSGKIHSTGSFVMVVAAAAAARQSRYLHTAHDMRREKGPRMWWPRRPLSICPPGVSHNSLEALGEFLLFCSRDSSLFGEISFSDDDSTASMGDSGLTETGKLLLFVQIYV